MCTLVLFWLMDSKCSIVFVPFWGFHHVPYPRHCSPGVLFFNMGFWVGVNSKNPPKSGLFKQKVGVYSRKTPKTRLFTLPGAQFKSGAAMTRIRYTIYQSKIFFWLHHKIVLIYSIGNGCWIFEYFAGKVKIPLSLLPLLYNLVLKWV